MAGLQPSSGDQYPQDDGILEDAAVRVTGASAGILTNEKGCCKTR